MKKLLLFLIMAASFSRTYGQQASATMFVTKIFNVENISLTTGQLSAFLKKYYPSDAAFDTMKIEKVNKKYFLLARDISKDRTYAFRLWKDAGSLFLSILYQVNACQCDCLQMEAFLVEKNKIIGCREGGHIIAGAF